MAGQTQRTCIFFLSFLFFFFISLLGFSYPVLVFEKGAIRVLANGLIAANLMDGRTGMAYRHIWTWRELSH